MLFDNTQKAYHLKSDKQLKKAYYLFQLISNQTLVSLGSWFAKIALKLKLPVAPIFKATVFSQFCAGLNKEESLSLVEKLKAYRIQSYLHFAAEESKTEQGMDLSLENTLETLSFQKNLIPYPFQFLKLPHLDLYPYLKKRVPRELLQP